MGAQLERQKKHYHVKAEEVHCEKDATQLRIANE
jgi:hypothetical protein